MAAVREVASVVVVVFHDKSFWWLAVYDFGSKINFLPQNSILINIKKQQFIARCSKFTSPQHWSNKNNSQSASTNSTHTHILIWNEQQTWRSHQVHMDIMTLGAPSYVTNYLFPFLCHIDHIPHFINQSLLPPVSLWNIYSVRYIDKILIAFPCLQEYSTPQLTSMAGDKYFIEQEKAVPVHPCVIGILHCIQFWEGL